MRLLWEESGFELVGAICVAAFSLGAAWTVFESMLGLNATVAGLFAAAAAGWVLEMISRRHYADRLAPAPRRLTAASRRPPAAPAAAEAAAERHGAATVAGRRHGLSRRAA